MSETQPKSGLLFLGTGVSSGLPQLCHALQFSPTDVREYVREPPVVNEAFFKKSSSPPAPKWRSACKTCLDAFVHRDGPNHRGNISIVVRVSSEQGSKDGDGHSFHHLLIDMGKTFRQSALTHLIPNGISRIDAVFLTHDHMDAAGGLDDIRDLQHFTRPIAPSGVRQYLPKTCIPLYCSEKTLEAVKDRYDYLYFNSLLEGPTDRKVARMTFTTVNDNPDLPLDTFDFHGLTVTVLPVLHGGDYKCLGLAFGPKDSTTVIITDVTFIPPSVEAFVAERRVDLLVLDAICPANPHFSHFTLVQGLEVVERWQPRRAYFVGMGCSLEHFEAQAALGRWLAEKKAGRGRVEEVALAHDGLFIPFV